MAVNALVIRNGIPVPVQREQFLHMDEGLSIEIGNNQYYKGKGKVYLTNLRLIFLKRDPNRQFSSFAVPYTFIQKYKLNKKLIGGPVVSATINCIINGGLNESKHGLSKFNLSFNDTNTGKAFYSLLEKEIKKCKNEQSNNKYYEKVQNTPTLPIEQIFPDQFAAFKQEQQQKQRFKQSQSHQNVLYSNNLKRGQQIVVGQSPNDAPMSLTDDYRAQKAKLFTSKSTKNVSSLGPITGASPVNFSTFRRGKSAKTVITDSNGKQDNYQNAKQQSVMSYIVSFFRLCFCIFCLYIEHNNQYNAYIDPDNPNDIVLSVPMDDHEFGHEIEGKVDNYNENEHKNVVNKGKNIAVAANLSDDDEDDFASRSKMGAAYAQNPKSKQVKKEKKKNINQNLQNGDYNLLNNDDVNENYKQDWETF